MHSIRKQLFLSAVPLLVVLTLVIGSLAMRFFPLREQVEDLRGDLRELSLANDLTHALNQHAIAVAGVLSGQGNAAGAEEWGRTLQEDLDAWIREKRDGDDAMEAIEMEAIVAIGRDAARLREISLRVMEWNAENRTAEAHALVASDLWPLIASVFRRIDDRATAEGMEVSQSLGVIQELSGFSYTPGAARLHDEVEVLRMEVAGQIEASRFARGVSRARLAYRYAQFVGSESVDEAVVGVTESSSAFTAWKYVMGQSRHTAETARLFHAIEDEYTRVMAGRPEMLRQIRAGRSSVGGVRSDRLLGMVRQSVTRSTDASGRSVSDVSSVATQALLLALALGGVAMIGGLSIPAVIGRRTLRRITSLQDSVRRIREGDLDVSVDAGAADELGQLAASFNEMARQLERTAAAREESDERFRHASRATNDVIWDWQVGPNSIWLNDAAKILLGLDLGAPVSCDTWQGLIHPDDVQRAQRSLQAALVGGADLWSEQYRFRRRDGSYADVFDRAVVVRDDAGRPVRVIGALVDLTSQRISEQTIASLSRQRQLLLDSVGDGIVGIDPAGEITFVNHGAMELLQVPDGALQGTHVHDVFHGTDSHHDRQSCPIQETVVSGSPYTTIDDHFLRGNRTKFAADFTANPVIDEDGAVVGGVVCFRDVTEKRALERMKSEFVSTVSHELRTPLTSIRAALGLLSSGKITHAGDRGLRMLDIAVVNTDRLVRLINDILDVEKLDSGTVLNPANVDGGGLIRQAIDVMKPMADKAGVSLSSTAGGEMILADPDRITQTLTNLISNAIKFSPPRSHVTISTSIKLGMWQCEVRDEGRGVPADKLEVIFERFQQVDASDSRQKGGTGLGLSICRSIIRQHGGRIWAESQLDHGSSFLFTVPLASQEQGEEDHPAAWGALTLAEVVGGS